MSEEVIEIKSQEEVQLDVRKIEIVDFCKDVSLRGRLLAQVNCLFSEGPEDEARFAAMSDEELRLKLRDFRDDSREFRNKQRMLDPWEVMNSNRPRWLEENWPIYFHMGFVNNYLPWPFYGRNGNCRLHGAQGRRIVHPGMVSMKFSPVEENYRNGGELNLCFCSPLDVFSETKAKKLLDESIYSVSFNFDAKKLHPKIFVQTISMAVLSVDQPAWMNLYRKAGCKQMRLDSNTTMEIGRWKMRLKYLMHSTT